MIAWLLGLFTASAAAVNLVSAAHHAPAAIAGGMSSPSFWICTASMTAAIFCLHTMRRL